MSVGSSFHRGSRHLCSSEEDEMSGVVMPKCRIDSGEEGSVGSTDQSPKTSFSALVPQMNNTPCTRSPRPTVRPSGDTPGGGVGVGVGGDDDGIMGRTSTLTRVVHSGNGQSTNRRSLEKRKADQSNREVSPQSSVSVASPPSRPSDTHGGSGRVQGLAPQHPDLHPLGVRSSTSPTARSSSVSSAIDATSQSEAAVPSQAPVATRASPSGFESHHASVPSVDEEPTCCICMEGYSEDNPMFRGECMHHFHLPCLLSWKQRSNSCPMCCSETLRGVGDLDDDRPATRSATTSASNPTAPTNFTDDEALALALQRKYLRRAKRKAEERKRSAALAQEQQLARQMAEVEHYSSARGSPQGGPAVAQTPPHSMALPPNAPPVTPAQTARGAPVREVTARSAPGKAPSSARRSSNKHSPGRSPQKGKGDCTVM